ncbi:probable calcium-transporting ATPase 5, plasma membrane-type [Phalaenopsis equestris]|uniref:probable calcium-transporting ATPase 5, plasma membrane-type n=1 Tax=Phalaenopsis equestris TaxID=78828 RepID=UPI0009E597D0|nr:probable calcium-transporting ATPase 5, plasma membrane-type [Phalaenopsis equestris]
MNAPLSAMQLSWVNMIMDTLGALALATEPPNDDMMKRPPTDRGESIITKSMWRNIADQSVYQLVVLGVLMFKGKHLLKLIGSDVDVVLNTFIFNTFVFCQLFNEINSREMEKFNIFHEFSSSWIFSTILLSTILFQIIIIEFLGAFASTVPLSPQLWLLSILIGSASLIIVFMLKCIPVGSAKLSSHSRNGYHPIPNGSEEDV